jgi:long-chain acyl-CoA synthetase
VSGPAADAEVDRTLEKRTVVEMWNRRVERSAGEVAFRFKEDNVWKGLTWTEADVYARELAAGLVELGVAPGDRVCIVSQTRLEWVICDVAILMAGAITVPIYPSSTADQSAFIVNDAGARVVITEDAAQLEKLLSVRAALPSVQAFVYMAGDVALERADARGRTSIRIDDVRPRDDASVRSLAELRAAGAVHPRGHAPGEAAIGPDDPFTIIYTSGTTGNPKGVVLSHRNLTSGVASACRAMTLFASDEQLLFLPLAHVLGRELAWVSVQAGLTTWFAESIVKLKDDLVEIRPTYMAGVPRVFEKFYAGVQTALAQGSPVARRIAGWALGVGRRCSEAITGGGRIGGWLGFQRAIADRLVFSKLRARLGLDRCRFLVSGGAPLAAEIAQFFHGVGIMIIEGYGLTETTAAAFLNRIDRFRFGTVGPALDVVDAKIAEDGEILMRGPSVFRVYHGNPAATAEAIDADGWFHSGDIGQFEDGFLRITDRKKDLIVTAGGKKVAPQVLENAIKMRIPLVSEALVFGDNRPYCVALVTPSAEAFRRFGADGRVDVAGPLRTAIAEELQRLNATLASYETIKEFAILPQDFSEAAGEITPSFKVKRKVVIDKHRQLIDGLYKKSRD